jgi:hypothetical protein
MPSDVNTSCVSVAAGLLVLMLFYIPKTYDHTLAIEVHTGRAAAATLRLVTGPQAIAVLCLALGSVWHSTAQHSTACSAPDWLGGMFMSSWRHCVGQPFLVAEELLQAVAHSTVLRATAGWLASC